MGMDPQLKKAIEDIKEKQKHQGPTIDYVELEKCLREFKTELYLKRDEVNQLRTELNAANLEMQNLRKVLDSTKKALDENQFNLSLQLKKARNSEEELQEKRESLMKIQLQHKMAITEVDTLKENLQKTEMEKIELSRKVDFFEAKQRHNSVYHNEILKKDSHLRNFMDNVNKMFIKLQNEHVQAIQLSNKTQIASEAIEKLKVCVRENEKLRKGKEQFEEMYIRISAKYEKLEELMKQNSSLNKPNLLTKVLFNQWKLSRSHYNSQMMQRNEILDKITKAITREKNTNIKLIRENESVKEINERLSEENVNLSEQCQGNSETIKASIERIKLLEESHMMKANQNFTHSEQTSSEIKDEPIEIDE